jgi:hypothetical protein
MTLNDNYRHIASILAQTAKDRGATVSDMAHDMGYPRKRLGQVLNGKLLDVEILANLTGYLLGMDLTLNFEPR